MEHRSCSTAVFRAGLAEFLNHVRNRKGVVDVTFYGHCLATIVPSDMGELVKSMQKISTLDPSIIHQAAVSLSQELDSRQDPISAAEAVKRLLERCIFYAQTHT